MIVLNEFETRILKALSPDIWRTAGQALYRVPREWVCGLVPERPLPFELPPAALKQIRRRNRQPAPIAEAPEWARRLKAKGSK